TDAPARQARRELQRVAVRRFWGRRRGSTESWRRRILRDAVHVDERAASRVMRMLRRFRQRQDGREANIRAFQHRGPFIARLRFENRRELRLQLVPHLRALTGGGIESLLRETTALESRLLDQELVKLRLERPDGNVLAVGGLVRVVVVRGARQKM